MKRYLLIASICIALLLGLWHLNLAMQAIFVFRNNEPLTSWAAILIGPGSTLIAALIAIFTKKVHLGLLLAESFPSWSLLSGKGELLRTCFPSFGKFRHRCYCLVPALFFCVVNVSWVRYGVSNSTGGTPRPVSSSPVQWDFRVMMA